VLPDRSTVGQRSILRCDIQGHFNADPVIGTEELPVLIAQVTVGRLGAKVNIKTWHSLFDFLSVYSITTELKGHCTASTALEETALAIVAIRLCGMRVLVAVDPGGAVFVADSVGEGARPKVQVASIE
jgi:hypothetical protein